MTNGLNGTLSIGVTVGLVRRGWQHREGVNEETLAKGLEGAAHPGHHAGLEDLCDRLA